MEMKMVDTRSKKSGLSALDVAVTALLIAAGAVIRMLVPPLGEITPNFAIAMYCLAIMLIRPRFMEALGIGLVAGAVCMFTSKAAYPVNLLSEPVGAVVCIFVFRLLEKEYKNIFGVLLISALATGGLGLTCFGIGKIFGISLKLPMIALLIMAFVVFALIYLLLSGKARKVINPFVVTALATMASGLTFIGTYYVFNLAPAAAIIAKMLPTVLILTGLNAIIVQVLYFPARSLIRK